MKRTKHAASSGARESSRPMERECGLTPEERLKLQQLRQASFWHERFPSLTSEPARAADEELVLVPEQWELTHGVDLHNWQRQCVDAWFANGRRGIIKVVTGAGKTILALAIAERLQKQQPELRVVVVVPTIVLLDQWRDELTTRGNLPHTAIGLMVGGGMDGFR